MSTYKRRLAVSTAAGGRMGWGSTRTPAAFRPTPASLGWVRPVQGVVAMSLELSRPVPPGAPPIELDDTVAVLDLPGGVPCASAGAGATMRLPVKGIGYTTVIVKGLGAPARTPKAADGPGSGDYVSCVQGDGDRRKDLTPLLAQGSGTWRARGVAAGMPRR